MSALVAAVGVPLAPADAAWVSAATAASAKAGPDATRTMVEPHCALGHALLRTSPRDESQPLSIDGAVWLSGDIRLDEPERLARRLGRPDAVDGPSDARLVLLAYHAWGDACLRYLTGDFAFALWDGPRQRLLCARDQVGVGQLHYARVGERIVLATGVGSVLLHPEVADDLDERAIGDLLVAGHLLDRSATAFAHVRQLLPAHALGWDAGGMRTWRYWDLPRPRRLTRFRSRDEYGEAFRDLLDAAVADRAAGEPVSVHLSGGMDSTSIAASACAGGRPAAAVRAVTAVLGAHTADREGEYATLVARRLGVAVDVIDVSACRAIDPLVPPAIRTPEPLIYMRTDFDYRFATTPAAHARVLLSGDGGDALLAFSPLWWLHWLADRRVADVARAFHEPLRVLRHRPHPHLRAIPGHLRRTAAPVSGVVPAWLSDDFIDRAGLTSSPAHGRGVDDETAALVSAPLWASIFRRGDPGFSGLPLRFRFPYFDLRLIAFVRSLAPEPWLVDKRILRDAGRGRLPAEVLARRKTPLVGVAPARDQAGDDGLRTLVTSSPDRDRFFDSDRLLAALRRRETLDPRAEQTLNRSLGLLYWLCHARCA